MGEDSTDLAIADGVAIPLAEIRFAYVRSSGPGGQNVNKVNSQAQLSWRVRESAALTEEVRGRLVAAQQRRISKAGILRIDSQKYRDRERNRQDCLEKLRAMVLRALEPPEERKLTKVPRRVHRRRLENKQQRSTAKQLRRPPRMDD